MPGHDESLFLELFGHVSGRGAGYFNPGLREDGTRDQHEDYIYCGVDRVQESLGEIERGGHVVGNSTGGVELGRTFTGLPYSKKLDQEVVGEAGVHHLADEEDVARERGLQHDGHIGCVEEADRVATTHTSLAGGFHGDFDAESLQVDHSCEDDQGREEVHDVGQILAVESFPQSTLLVGPGEKQVEEGNDSALELGTTASVNGGRGEGFPDYGFADVGRNEQGDS